MGGLPYDTTTGATINDRIAVKNTGNNPLAEVRQDGVPIKTIHDYEDISLLGKRSQRDFDVRFGYDPTGRLWHSITQEDSSIQWYQPWGIHREELRRSHIERLLVDTVHTYLDHQGEMSEADILSFNREFYRQLCKDLLGEA